LRQMQSCWKRMGWRSRDLLIVEWAKDKVDKKAISSFVPKGMALRASTFKGWDVSIGLVPAAGSTSFAGHGMRK